MEKQSNKSHKSRQADPSAPLDRKPKNFNPMVTSKTLLKDLPFASKPKDTPARKKPRLEEKRAVVMDNHERKTHALVQQLHLIKKKKEKNRKLKEAKKRKAHEAQKAKDEQLSKKRRREERRERYREEDKAKKRKTRRNADD